MANFLFWNLFKKDLSGRVIRLVKHHQIDVLLLAEYEATAPHLGHTLGTAEFPKYQRRDFTAFGAKVAVYTRTSESRFVLKKLDLSKRVSIFEVTLDRMAPFLLAAVHLASPHHLSKSSRADLAKISADNIRTIEEQEGHRRTVLVGDLNMDPYDEGMVSAVGYHAVMTQATARKRERVIQGTPSPFFYNPMWEFFGDRSRGPAGTYYRQGSDPVNYFWHLYDQVLVRPALIDHLQDVEILVNDGQESLLNRSGQPDQRRASDHLPLLFRIG